MTEPCVLHVVGDGPVAEALVAVAAPLGWTVTTATDDATLPDGVDALVVTSHHDGVDGPAIRAGLAAGTAYIGGMGSRRTQERRRAWLLGHGVTEEALARVHAPIGLDIGANAPGEIAVAILAEVIAVRAGRAAVGSVGDREGPIHPDLSAGDAYCPGG
ncbi:XdhC Rossmann domain-containing protein [Pedococcus dokdonensis]|uniref:XdhC Rossmann domain-containing protein n=1 Tax=Pedococcus dokdonensis TaxID=443156 RepID=A0A1H0Q5G4_9MICO|nr:XdhC family protein [Pedococcus dokdonensis]SDP12657.1 XdhC Rossmann domain-containing protein [Pedococcus dokdonensis]